MRQKTMYANRPDNFQIVPGDKDQAIIYIRLNIEEVQNGEDTAYQADEYALTVPFSADLDKRVRDNLEAWTSVAVAHDREAVAALVRAQRDKLLQESDSEMCLDRLGLTVPTGSTFTAWISFFRALGDVLLGHVAAYRQALRDLPEQPGFPYDIEWPTK